MPLPGENSSPPDIDCLIQRLSQHVDRRGLGRLAAGSLTAAALASLGDDAEAKKKKKKKKGKKKKKSKATTTPAPTPTTSTPTTAGPTTLPPTTPPPQVNYVFDRPIGGMARDMPELLDSPYDVGADCDGSVYVVGYVDDVEAIKKYDADGAFIRAFPYTPSGINEREFISSFAVDCSGRMYILEIGIDGDDEETEERYYRIVVLDSEGARIGILPDPPGGAIDNISAITVDRDGRIFASGYTGLVSAIYEYNSALSFVAAHELGYIDARAVDDAGRLYTSNRLGLIYYLTIYDTSDFSITTTFGEEGQIGGRFNIAVDASGSVFITNWDSEQGQGRVQKLVWDEGETELVPDGTLVSWGNGEPLGSLQGLQGVTVGSEGTVYIADPGNDRILKVSNDLEPLYHWGAPLPGHYRSGPNAIARDSAGNLYILDGDTLIHKLASNGAPIKKWGRDGRLEEATSLAVSPAGRLYVADPYNHRIQIFDSDGNPQDSFAPSQSEQPWALAFDAAGNLYVTDHDTYRIEKFNSAHVHQGGWTGPSGFEPEEIAVSNAGIVYVTDWYEGTVRTFTTSGAPHGVTFSVTRPSGIAVDTAGRILVGSESENRVHVYAANGSLISTFGGSGQFGEITGIVTGPGGEVWVTDRENGVLRFTPAAGRTAGGNGDARNAASKKPRRQRKGKDRKRRDTSRGKRRNAARQRRDREKRG